ncbi:MAG: UDP-N-acetylmuramoyl-tripeptide--D-alanyl-D-alanine ligase [Desulfuromonas sp.]|nr:MAG: UDP-N-acetylmuramoyl-tripeptide--D-alanyl-D-alanine ligase [Desulfuromonas sp.]
MEFNIRDIARITEGTLYPADARGMVDGISTDSRTIGSGELFVPLRGPNFDGHDFLTLAVKSGAAACLSEDVVNGLPVPVIVVDDTLKALGRLAADVRNRFAGPVVGITGSSGKTTTKEMLAGILSLTRPGLLTAGNFNNLIGLPLTLFRNRDECEWMVLEMGMSARGEIARLSEIASPTVGIITNIGPAHLETLHGMEGVARAKGELFEALPEDGFAIVNADDDFVVNLPVANKVRRILYGSAESAEIRAESIIARGSGVTFRLVTPEGNWPVQLKIAGRHNVYNALAAAAAAHVLGVDGRTIVRGLEQFQPCCGRMETISLGCDVLLLEDSYNANPLSVKAALQTLSEMNGLGRHIAVLGDMLELGEQSAELHTEVGRQAADLVDILIVMGEMKDAVAAGYGTQETAAKEIYLVNSHQEAIDILRDMIQPGDRILVKGSRGMRMEKVSKALRGMHFCMAANG